jgi:septum formation protein
VSPPGLILASASPRRRELLASIGLDAVVRPTYIDESVHSGEQPIDYARRLAAEKAMARALGPGELTLAADTVVALGSEIFGKPVDDTEAVWMLTRLAGRVHEVITAVAVRGEQGLEVGHEVTRVTVAPLGDADIAAYVASGEPHDKAGAYAIQGAFAAFVDHLDGTWSNVVGLPLPLVRRLLAPYGIEVRPRARPQT